MDKLKRRTNKQMVSEHSSCAIKYLKSKHQRMLGQNAENDNVHIINISSDDDRILNCCLQLKDQSKEVILITNDFNLCNKALLSDIEAFTSEQFLQKHSL